MTVTRPGLGLAPPPVVALKPNVTVPPGAILALYDSLRAVTVAPDWVTFASHASRTRWSPVNAKRTLQPLTAVAPVFRMVSCPVNPVPPCQAP